MRLNEIGNGAGGVGQEMTGNIIGEGSGIFHVDCDDRNKGTEPQRQHSVSAEQSDGRRFFSRLEMNILCLVCWLYVMSGGSGYQCHCCERDARDEMRFSRAEEDLSVETTNCLEFI